MDTDGFPLAAISETSIIDDNPSAVKSKKRKKRAPLPPIDSNGGTENGNIVTSQFNQSATLETSFPSDPSIESKSSDMVETGKFNHYEVTSLSNASDDIRLEEKNPSERPSQFTSEQDPTMVSSYTTGAADNDVIEIHQFSSADIEAYLDIYFETLDNRLRHYIGQNEQLQQFRVAMKNRINSNRNAREYQNVLLGKMNGEVLAAVTMSFPGETPTIPFTLNVPEQNSCLTSIRRWMTRKSNYVPTNMEECYIEMIGVKSAYQNHGIGSAMLECVEHFARQAGATLLTVHIHGQQLRNYFERFGFNLDQSDNSSFWKWIVERQNAMKLSKPLSIVAESTDYSTGSYLNGSMTEEE